MKIYTLLKVDEQGGEQLLMASEDMNKVFSKINCYKDTLYLQTWNGGKKGSRYLIKKYNESNKIISDINENSDIEITGELECINGLYSFITNEEKDEDTKNNHSSSIWV